MMRVWQFQSDIMIFTLFSLFNNWMEQQAAHANDEEVWKQESDITEKQQ